MYHVSMSYFRIKGSAGKRTLSGSVDVSGAKNAALKAIASSVLFSGPITISNLPEIEDVSRMLDLLESMGASVSRAPHRAIIDTRNIGYRMTAEISKRLRASIVLTGPLLSRFGKVTFPHPGGCVIGARPIDAFEEAFRAMGAKVSFKGKIYSVSATGGRLRGAEIFFRKQTVTGTETAMMAAVNAVGKTVIKNAAMEPEIVWLAESLNAHGARISGAGTPTIVIVPSGKGLRSRGVPMRVMPDRIEAGSFIILAALAGKKVEVRGCEPLHLDSLISHLRASGVRIRVTPKSVVVLAPTRNLVADDIKTHEYPGFPTDLQAPMTVFLTQCDGESLVFETIFEGRLVYTDSLNQMGANIQLMDAHRALVRGATPLRARKLESPDLRAGLAFVIAAITAEGVSTIHNIYNIDRGYEHVEERLRALGVDIERVEE
jgi:UDP-N-acetylglucosamine 1-carboxyvinyltransferase